MDLCNFQFHYLEGPSSEMDIGSSSNAIFAADMIDFGGLLV